MSATSTLAASPATLGGAGATRSLPRIFALEAKYELLRTLRVPGFVISSLAFPAMFYVFFGIVFGKNSSGGLQMGTYLLATYGTFGVMASALFGFGVSVAVERGYGWLKLKRATPMPPAAYLFGKLFMSAVFAALVVLLLFALGFFFAAVRMPLQTWLSLAGVLVAGALPFSAIGLAIGSWVKPQAAPAVVNLVYLPMSFFSGLWVPIQFLPKGLQSFSLALPPYHLSQLALKTIGQSQGRSVALHVTALVAVTALGLAVAYAGYRNAERTA